MVSHVDPCPFFNFNHQANRKFGERTGSNLWKSKSRVKRCCVFSVGTSSKSTHRCCCENFLKPNILQKKHLGHLSHIVTCFFDKPDPRMTALTQFLGFRVLGPAGSSAPKKCALRAVEVKELDTFRYDSLRLLKSEEDRVGRCESNHKPLLTIINNH